MCAPMRCRSSPGCWWCWCSPWRSTEGEDRMLQTLLIVPFAAAVAVLLLGQTPRIAVWMAFCGSLVPLIVAIAAYLQYRGEPLSSGLYDVSVPWIPELGINFHIAMDGMSA